MVITEYVIGKLLYKGIKFHNENKTPSLKKREELELLYLAEKIAGLSHFISIDNGATRINAQGNSNKRNMAIQNGDYQLMMEQAIQTDEYRQGADKIVKHYEKLGKEQKSRRKKYDYIILIVVIVILFIVLFGFNTYL